MTSSTSTMLYSSSAIPSKANKAKASKETLAMAPIPPEAKKIFVGISPSLAKKDLEQNHEHLEQVLQHLKSHGFDMNRVDMMYADSLEILRGMKEEEVKLATEHFLKKTSEEQTPLLHAYTRIKDGKRALSLYDEFTHRLEQKKAEGTDTTLFQKYNSMVDTEYKNSEEFKRCIEEGFREHYEVHIKDYPELRKKLKTLPIDTDYEDFFADVVIQKHTTILVNNRKKARELEEFKNLPLDAKKELLAADIKKELLKPAQSRKYLLSEAGPILALRELGYDVLVYPHKTKLLDYLLYKGFSDLPIEARVRVELCTYTFTPAIPVARAEQKTEVREKEHKGQVELEAKAVTELATPRDQELKAQIEAEERAKIAAEERARLETQRAKIAAEERAKIAAEERAKIAAEEREKIAAEEREKIAAEIATEEGTKIKEEPKETRIARHITHALRNDRCLLALMKLQQELQHSAHGTSAQIAANDCMFLYILNLTTNEGKASAPIPSTGVTQHGLWSSSPNAHTRRLAMNTTTTMTYP